MSDQLAEILAKLPSEDAFDHATPEVRLLVVQEAVRRLGWGTMTYRCDQCHFEWEAPAMAKPKRRARFTVDLVTGQQLAVFRLLADGRNITEAAGELEISPHTARTHVKNAQRRLGAHTQGQVIAILFRQGVLR